MDRVKSRLNALVVIDKHRKRRNLLRRSYLKKVKCARQNYKPEDVLAAMHAIWRGMSRRQAAKVFNIPRSTLLDKLDGKRPVDASPGPNPFLTKAEERTLESWAIDLYQRGFPLKTEDLKDMAQAVIQNNQRRTSFRNGRPGRSWMRNFLLRHPKIFEISVDMGPGPRRSRTVTSREEVRQWCQQHRQFLSSLGQESILDHPDRVFNVDHGEFSFDSTTGNLLEQDRNERLEDKDPEKVEHTGLSNGNECVSIVATFSAAGRKAPIMFVHSFKDFDENFDPLPPGWIGTHTECGLINGKVFLDYIIALRQWLEQENIPLPILLLVDGRRSRLNMDVTRYCEEQGIILYCLFPTPRPAITELFSSVYHDSFNGITKYNFTSRINEALTAADESNSNNHSHKILPHLQTMLQTLAEVRLEPIDNVPSLFPSGNSIGSSNGGSLEGPDMTTEPLPDIESDCEFDFDLTPVEGEIEIEFHCSENCDPYALALHPALLAGSEAPSFLVFDAPYVSAGSIVCPPNNDSRECFEDRVDQPDVSAHLIVKPLSSPLPDTDRGIAKVESEIDNVLGTILSMETSHEVAFENISQDENPSEEPFLGFSFDNPHCYQSTLDAQRCIHFMENYLKEKGFFEDFKAARCQREWHGIPEAKILFDVWLAACDECNL